MKTNEGTSRYYIIFFTGRKPFYSPVPHFVNMQSVHYNCQVLGRKFRRNLRNNLSDTNL